MIDVHQLPTLNAALNATATVLMTAGFICIKRGKREAHRACMLSAGAASAVFLAGYLYYHIATGARTPFGGEGAALRAGYYTMLLTHVVLAAACAFLVPRTFWFALKGNYEKHKRWARYTFPIWYYVSLTGVLVYFSLYVWWPATR